MRRRALATGLVILLAAGLSACASGPDLQTRRHTVQKGENLYRISKRYGTTVDALARANRLADPTPLTEEELDEGFACFGTEDFQIGYRAFLKKQQPEFKGK